MIIPNIWENKKCSKPPQVSTGFRSWGPFRCRNGTPFSAKGLSPPTSQFGASSEIAHRLWSGVKGSFAKAFEPLATGPWHTVVIQCSAACQASLSHLTEAAFNKTLYGLSFSSTLGKGDALLGLFPEKLQSSLKPFQTQQETVLLRIQKRT